MPKERKKPKEQKSRKYPTRISESEAKQLTKEFKGRVFEKQPSHHPELFSTSKFYIVININPGMVRVFDEWENESGMTTDYFFQLLNEGGIIEVTE